MDKRFDYWYSVERSHIEEVYGFYLPGQNSTNSILDFGSEALYFAAIGLIADSIESASWRSTAPSRPYFKLQLRHCAGEAEQPLK